MTRPRKAAFILAVLLLLGTALVPMTGLAQDDEADEEAEDHVDDSEADEDEDEEDSIERKVAIESDGNSVEIKLERENGSAEDEVKMTWDADEGTFELEHEAENETQETENKLEATFGALVEYRDEDDDNGYDPGEAIVSGWALGDAFEDEGDHGIDGEADWEPATIEDITRDGEQGKLITSTASLGDEGAFTLRFLVFGDFVNLNGTDLSPTSAKIDIVIEDYPYQTNDTDLGLFLETKTETEFEQDIDDDDETGVQAQGAMNGTGSSLVFTWLDTAQVDGTTHDVATTVLAEELETEQEEDERSTEHKRSFVLSYPRGDEIIHDPKAEVLLASNATTDVPTAGLPGILAVLATVSTLLTYRTRED